MEAQIYCPRCDSTKTFATPETAFERFCTECDAVWQIWTDDELEKLGL